VRGGTDGNIQSEMGQYSTAHSETTYCVRPFQSQHSELAHDREETKRTRIPIPLYTGRVGYGRSMHTHTWNAKKRFVSRHRSVSNVSYTQVQHIDRSIDRSIDRHGRLTSLKGEAAASFGAVLELMVLMLVVWKGIRQSLSQRYVYSISGDIRS
jgi:hypothetical protein